MILTKMTGHFTKISGLFPRKQATGTAPRTVTAENRPFRSMAALRRVLDLARIRLRLRCRGALQHCVVLERPGLFDSALAHMQIVATLYPECPFTPQAWLYSGEYMFDKGNLARAIQCYQTVMKYPESEWFDEAALQAGMVTIPSVKPRKSDLYVPGAGRTRRWERQGHAAAGKGIHGLCRHFFQRIRHDGRKRA